MDNNTTDYELTLFDRVEIIKTTNQKYDLENNAYLSFSGGKDSTILHHLLDMALPNNHIPRVFINTGIEYQMIVDFVKELASKDDRFVILKPTTPIKPMLEKYGYPFKSKEHSLYVQQYQKNGTSKTCERYLNPSENRKKFGCPHILRYQFSKDFSLKVSNKCCYELKKKPIHQWQKENQRAITITGMRKSEGGNRKNIQGCVLTDGKGKLKKFHPLLVVNDKWEDEFIERESITICPLYCQPYNFTRTGCAGCPYALDLQTQLDTLDRLLPNERRKCEILWKPVYDEYRRLNYRLKNTKQLDIFEEN